MLLDENKSLHHSINITDQTLSIVSIAKTSMVDDSLKLLSMSQNIKKNYKFISNSK